MKLKKLVSVVSASAIGLMCMSFNAAAAVKGDANGDGKLDIRDAAYISNAIVTGKARSLSLNADYNNDGKVNIRDAAAIAAKVGMPRTELSKAEEVLNLVNQERAKVGADPLKLNSTLVDMANLRAREINETFSHTRPDGTSCFTVFDEYDVNWSYVGENIAAGNATAKDTVNQWVNSSGHYANMINSNFTELGVGYFYDPNSVYKHYWVQLFRRPLN